ncbi:uroporphyrinogen-III synthase [Leucobacter chinensis]|uniref:uroporphyrinogen-III synthase n=1 Tax=Leucobacter chinensis TaxID=2851010 RepID=UPI001C2141AC|nr:uroporphyrinogen-III synthase [Leucobacter chinensis]
MSDSTQALEGLRVLVPRGGTWGEIVSRALRNHGANTVISPLVDFASSGEEAKLVEALHRLEAGEFDWLTATNPTVVNVLRHHNTVIPTHTQLAVVGDATEAAFVAEGYEVARTPEGENTAEGLLQTWPEITGEKLRVLTLRSNVAKPVVTAGLIDRGHSVTQIVAFRTVGVPASVHTREDVESGHINVLLVATPQIAHEVKNQFADRPDSTLIACVGPNTREEAKRIGLRVDDGDEHPQVNQIIDAVESVIDYSDTLD